MKNIKLACLTSKWNIIIVYSLKKNKIMLDYYNYYKKIHTNILLDSNYTNI